MKGTRQKSSGWTKGGSLPSSRGSSENSAAIKVVRAHAANVREGEVRPPHTVNAIPKWKRALDLTFVSLAFPLWFLLMILIIVYIKLSSRGPAFYRQERIGLRGKKFMLYKFRSMKVNAATQLHEDHFQRLMRTDAPMVKLDAADRRIIPGGRILRATGLDELPQLFNILLGEMSIVGPRPCTVREFAGYQPWQRERVNSPPGLTGYWQVNGKNQTTFKEMIQMDIFYARKACLKLDLLIMAKTLPAIWRQVTEMQPSGRTASGSNRKNGSQSFLRRSVASGSQ